MPAPREIVFQEWIDPEGIRVWMCPGNATSTEATLDVRVGGSFRLVMKGKDRDHVQTGIYKIVDPPSKLVFTWVPADNPGAATMVTVEFFAHGEESEIVITHEGFQEPDGAERYQGGWGTIAKKFAGYLAVKYAPQ